ncbi:MAG: hypothetical protein U0165_12905 [Polyangiaceae bacterium]
MSRAYRVSWVTVSSTVTSKETLSMKLSLLGILPEDDMLELLRAELEKDGWKDCDGTLSAKIKGDLKAELSKDGKEVVVSSEVTQKVQTTAVSQNEAQSQLKQAEVQVQERLAGQATAALTAAEPDVRARLGEVIQRVYVEALKRKAAQLGQVTGMQETTLPNGEREVTIKVRT